LIKGWVGELQLNVTLAENAIDNELSTSAKICKKRYVPTQRKQYA
jgi:hypothetical protein